MALRSVYGFSNDEITKCRKWLDMAFCKPVVAFDYDGVNSQGFAWKSEKTVSENKGDLIYSVRYTCPETTVAISTIYTVYKERGAVDWVSYIENTGDKDSGILSDIKAWDGMLETVDAARLCLNYSNGSKNQVEDFLPQRIRLDGSLYEFGPDGGRSSDGILPFFNLENMDEKGGYIFAIGWSGQWRMRLISSPGSVNIRTGLEHTRLALHAGEKIRTPSMLLLFYESDTVRAHNLFRQVMLDYYTPHYNGEPAIMPISVLTWGYNTQANHLEQIQAIKNSRIGIDTYWVDAGWYGEVKTENFEDWYLSTGTWETNSRLYPDTMRAVGEGARKAGLRFMLWFEPERAVEGTDWHVRHPEWMYPVIKHKQSGIQSYLFNWGAPGAKEFVFEELSEKIEEFGIDIYRQDFNTRPLNAWREQDAPNRQGMTEIRHIEGLYWIWDMLLKRFPGLMIDNCSSGGKRLDIETCKRSIPMWRSDFFCLKPPYDPTGNQVQTCGLARWIPVSGLGYVTAPMDTYAMHSNLGAGTVVKLDYDLDSCKGEAGKEGKAIIDRLRHGEVQVNTRTVSEGALWMGRMLEQQKVLRPYYHGDFYALQHPTMSLNDWGAWQLDRPDLGSGIVQVYCRENSPFLKGSFRLNGLDAEAEYEIEDLNTGEKTLMSGEALLSDFEVSVPAPRNSKLYRYSKSE